MRCRGSDEAGCRHTSSRVRLAELLAGRAALQRTVSGRLSLVLAVAIAAWLTALPTQAVTTRELPSPLEGPGAPSLTRSQTRSLQRSWRELADGDLEAAAKRAGRARDTVPGQLLAAQIRLAAGEADVKPDLVALCDRNPDYAGAWITLSVAAERVGDEIMALFAARRGAELWSDPRWTGRAEELEGRWVTERLERARGLLRDGSLESALTETRMALELAPDAPGAAVLEAEILLAAGRLDDAEAALADAPDSPGSPLIRGRIAELRGDWQAAMESYAMLPADHPERGAALDRAQIRWRLSVLPAHVDKAMASERLSRGELAVILVSLQPRLETLPGGSIPVMSDIVDHPGQREIVTAVRLGIMDADLLDHRFHPEAPASPAAVRRALDRAAVLLGESPARWCEEEDVVGSSCTSLGSPVTGEAVVNAVLDKAPGAGR
ncbi:MAG TPA: tetratricopeptide repeat protein [Methylomirabilota bacterium]|nr:tetratricopeptide repeat protein [Methylomirabilota bacterium]